MKKVMYLVFPLLACLLVLGACEGKKEDEKVYSEIKAEYQNKLRSPDHDVTLSIYKNKDDERQYFVEERYPNLNKIYYSIWDKGNKKEKDLDPLKQETKDYKDKYIDKGEKVYETTIDYDNKEK